MKPIPQAIIEKTWQEVAGFSPVRAKKEKTILGSGLQYWNYRNYF
jgi:hypothetical protein